MEKFILAKDRESSLRKNKQIKHPSTPTFANNHVAGQGLVPDHIFFFKVCIDLASGG